MGLVVRATPRPLYSRERPDIHFIGGWVGPRAGLDGWTVAEDFNFIFVGNVGI
jgi:hypothetical protein